MLIKFDSFNLRSFLRMGSSVLALLFLESFAKPNTVVSPAQKRMVFLGGAFGFTKKTFYPSKARKFREIGMTEGLEPLARHQDNYTMVTNLTNIGATDPHGGSVSYLTGANVAGTLGKRFHNSISCDQVAARHLGQETRYESLILSAKEKDGSQNSGHGPGLSLSWDDDGKPIPGLNKPLDSYQELFAHAGQSKEKLTEQLQKNKAC